MTCQRFVKNPAIKKENYKQITGSYQREWKSVVSKRKGVVRKWRSIITYHFFQWKWKEVITENERKLSQKMKGSYHRKWKEVISKIMHDEQMEFDSILLYNSNTGTNIFKKIR